MFLMRYYVRLEIKGGDFHEIYKEHPRLIVLARHSSHLDGAAIHAGIPFSYWSMTRIGAAKDYFFAKLPSKLFFTHFVRAIPIERSGKWNKTVNLCLDLLNKHDRLWLVLFPEGGRTKLELKKPFKRGVSVFSQKTNTPLLFVYVEGSAGLWPKGNTFPRPGKVILHIGPIHPPAEIEEIESAYSRWTDTILAHA
jgi:1-acyl-sn-glycerol-3-phosphate acyltransferase